jgi:hypothetical protein
MQIIKIITILFFWLFCNKEKKEIETNEKSKNQKYIEACWILEKSLERILE